jgi:glycerol-3-phosphate acyltransferase PlsY
MLDPGSKLLLSYLVGSVMGSMIMGYLRGGVDIRTMGSGNAGSTLGCATASVVGHVWPVWHKFKGGKGAATLIGTLIVLAPEIVLPLLLIWAWMLVLFGYVGLATMTTAIVAPLYLGLTRLPHDQALFYYCLAMALYMIYSHRANIIRMRKGTEPKNTRLMIFRRGDRNSGDGKD